MREFIIKDNDAGQRLDKFLQKAARLLPQSLMYKYLRLKRIKVNGRRSEISYRLQPGDKVSLYIGDEFFDSERPAFYRASPQIRVVYEDENILLCDKPQGLIVHEDEGESVDTLINRVQRYLYDKGEYRPDEEASFAPALCNRIDRNTGGIVIVAKNAPSLRLLNDCIKNRQLHKFYLCLVKGCPSPRTATLTHYHIKDQPPSRGPHHGDPLPGAGDKGRLLPGGGGAEDRPHPSDSGAPGLYGLAAGGGRQVRRQPERAGAGLHPSGALLLQADF